ncbi:MAG: alpha/beta hydrolase family protein, partial [Acidimicrobiia bacterium]|nr:alpha/beta hydrolase family protein [Acidimicrobiia bacterium]
MHPIDRAAALLFRFGPSSLNVFTDGWGNDEQRATLDTSVDLQPPASLAIDWDADRESEGLTFRDGSFASPASHLPTNSATAYIRMIKPAVTDGRLVLMMAAWNEHGYGTRTALARLLAQNGMTSVILENPFYGLRRTGTGQPIRTVADFGVMGRAAVEEGLALLAHFADDYRVGVTGYSMGGYIAALVGALAPSGTAIAALAASHSPGPVWTDGIIRHVVDWDALGGEEMAPRLGRELGRATVRAVEPLPHTSQAVIVGATGDGYIPRHAVEDLHAHWPGSELRWINAGHA